MKNTNFITIQGWMINELNLKDKDLIIYALIYGFCQDKESRYSGSSSYIIDTLKYSKSTSDRCLKRLTESGFIIKEEVVKNRVTFNDYFINFDLFSSIEGGVVKLTNSHSQNDKGGIVNLTNNTTNNNTTNKTTNNAIDFSKLLDFINKQTKRSGKEKFRVINKSIIAKYKARLKDGYKKEDFINAIKNASKNNYHIETNFKYLTPEFFSRADKIDLYAFVSSSETKQQKPKEEDGLFPNY